MIFDISRFADWFDKHLAPARCLTARLQQENAELLAGLAWHRHGTYARRRTWPGQFLKSLVLVLLRRFVLGFGLKGRR